VQFKDVIGQEEVKAQLLREFQSGKIPHAQMFLARKGTGGLAMAMAFAQYLLCDNQSETDSCSVCPSCSKVSQLIHPDLHFSFPTVTTKAGKSTTSVDYIKEWRNSVLQTPYMTLFDWLQVINAENKQGNITAEECRSLSNKLQLKSFEGKFKVQIIWMAETLGKEGNILLKLLEEPPENTILILVAEDQEAILGTILSRTQVKNFHDLSSEAIKRALMERQQLAEEQALKVAFIADGDFHQALTLLGSNAMVVFDYLEVWLSASLNKKGSETMQFVESISKEGRETIKKFLDYALHFFRECLSVQYKTEDRIKLSSREKALATKIWQITNLERLSRLIPLIEEKHYHIERNANSKYVLLDLSIQTEKVLRGKI
jgi:DNA polymerase-3 subunit delta'